MQVKRCPGCGESKSIDEFGRNRAAPDKRCLYCKPCHNAKCAAAKKRSPRNAALGRRYYETPGGRARMLRASARQRKGDDVFSAEWLEAKIAAGRCEVTGIEFDLGRMDGVHQNPLAPSIDRIDSARGYTEDNVQVVIFAFNSLKGEMANGDAVALLKRMAANL